MARVFPSNVRSPATTPEENLKNMKQELTLKEHEQTWKKENMTRELTLIKKKKNLKRYKRQGTNAKRLMTNPERTWN